MTAAPITATSTTTTTTAGPPPTEGLPPPTGALPSAGPPPTAGALPSAPRNTALEAAAALISDWARGRAAEAAEVATASAVAALFAETYPPGDLQPRGCTTGPTPATCTYRDTAAATPTIYQLTVTDAAGGWYVSAVTVER